MLKEAEIRTFVDGTTNYFEVSGRQPATGRAGAFW